MYRELYLQAQAMLEFAYAPYSKFSVGAALLDSDGQMHTGVNIENASYGATICAERVAFGRAIADGKRKFEAIAIVSSKGEALPCGICRQFMYEFAPDIKIITGKNEDCMQIYELEELLPKGFKL